MRTLNSAVIATVAALSIIGVAHAAEPVFATTQASQPSADTLRRLSAVCSPGAFVLTGDAQAICASGQFPALTKAGTGFRNAGVGAEFNTLMRQVPAVTAAN